MADQETVVKYLAFKCPCGVVLEKIVAIAITDQHEQLVFYECHRCDAKLFFSTKLTQLYKACPSRPALEQKPKDTPAPEQKSPLTSADRKFMRRIGFCFQQDEEEKRPKRKARNH